MTVIAVPEPLRNRLGPEGSNALVDLLNQATGKIRDDLSVVLDERFERRLAEEFGKLRQDIAGLRDDLTGKIAGLEKDLAGLKGELVAWTFLFWLGTIGILFTFFRP